MAASVATTKPPARSRRAKWLRRVVAAVAYLLCWAVTWAFAPAAVNRFWAAHHKPTTRDFRGNEEPVEFRTGVPFTGTGLEYWPDFTPQGKWWCCVGRPWCPAPFVVGCEVARVDGPLSGFAAKMWFVWTPFGLIPIHERFVWVA